MDFCEKKKLLCFKCKAVDEPKIIFPLAGMEGDKVFLYAFQCTLN